MIYFPRFVLVFLGLAWLQAAETQTKIETIVIGSCADQKQPQPFWPVILDQEPDLFLFIGDNVYADGSKYRKLKREYAKLGRMEGFGALREQSTMMAIWDDHDYGLNDGGREYAKKHHSKKAFLRFFRPPKTSRVWLGPGLYRQRTFGEPGQRVQVIMLDTRFFRSRLNVLPKDQWSGKGRFLTDDDPTKTMLGNSQWDWLARCLKMPAEFRIIVSSIQAISNEHQWEKWGNLPHERHKLFKLIKDSGAKGVMLVSGDRHSGEISKLPAEDADGVGYPLFEVTASGLNTRMASDPNEPNRYRLGERQLVHHFAVVKIQWSPQPLVSLQLRATTGDALGDSVRFALKDLQ